MSNIYINIRRYLFAAVLFTLIVLPLSTFADIHTVESCSDLLTTYHSLRYCIAAASEGDIIEFNLTTSSGLTTEGSYKWYKIDRTGAPIIITKNKLQIRGSSQRGKGNESNPFGPVVEIRSNNWEDIFRIQASDVTIEGLAINRIGQDGEAAIQLQSTATNAHIYGCYIGVTATGEAIKSPMKSGAYGIEMITVNNCVIGSSEPGQGNVISSGTDHSVSTGILISSSSNNTVIGNHIGTNANGSKSVPNFRGIHLLTSTYNKIGNGTAGGRNYISGNVYPSSSGTACGIYISGSGVNFNKVLGNYIGVSGDGLSVLPNDIGVYIESGQYNMIGGTKEGEGNIISGNNDFGVYIAGGSSPQNNSVLGNYIGVDKNGLLARPNNTGIYLGRFAYYTVIGNGQPGGGNIISGNSNYGIQLDGMYAYGEQILGNIIGVDKNGSLRPNGYGIYLGGGTYNNIIGNGTESGCNVISGNSQMGIYITGTGTNSNEVRGNYIGVSADGVSALGNGVGITISGEARYNLIGKGAGEKPNVISGNNNAGILMTGISTTGASPDSNSVLGNYIGVDKNGSLRPNMYGIYLCIKANKNIIGNGTESGCNVISGNSETGIFITGTDTNSNEIRGNYIGVGTGGYSDLGNTVNGIVISGNAKYNFIGKGAGEKPNVISGNNNAGILMGGTAANNWILGNYIGVDKDGSSLVPNNYGIYLSGGPNNNKIGNGVLGGGGGNVISGNTAYGIWIAGASNSNEVLGNYIGVFRDGSLIKANNHGLFLSGGARYNKVGDGQTGGGGRNIISGNTNYGIWISGESTASNEVVGNHIGTNGLGSVSKANDYGICLSGSAKGNKIGNGTFDGRNIISGNTSCGIWMKDAGTDGNQVLKNYIGVNKNGTAAIIDNHSICGIGIIDGVKHSTIEGNVVSGNAGKGILINATGAVTGTILNNRISNNEIGISLIGPYNIPNQDHGICISNNGFSNCRIIGNTIGPSNSIVNNLQSGIYIDGQYATAETITQNIIYNNTVSGISLVANGNQGILPPVIASAQYVNHLTVTGTSSANAVIEVFSSNGGQGAAYLGNANANGAGNWTAEIAGTFTGGEPVTATQTGTGGSTSGFSGVKQVVVLAPTTVVSNCSDSGYGSLREAITNAAAWDQIKFNIHGVPDSSGADDSPGLVTEGGKKWYRIIVNSSLPTIEVGHLQILGSTQTWEANNTGPSVEVRANGGFDIFKCKSEYVTIEGLTINRIGNDKGTAIALEAGADNAHIYGCYIGTTATGESPAPKPSDYGISLAGVSDCTIGGPITAQRNVISGNIRGMYIFGSSNNEVKGNYIGISASGSKLLGNTYGMLISGPSINNIIGGNTSTPGMNEGNVISGNLGYGISITGSGTDSNEVLGNCIGTDATGGSALPNNYGIYLAIGAKYNRIGNGTDNGRNVISGNFYGIDIYAPGTNSNEVLGNYIGTNAGGSSPVANTYGIWLRGGAKYNKIGDGTAGVHNIISGNNVSMRIEGTGTDSNEVLGNYIGVSADGTSALPNNYGLWLTDEAKYNLIGNGTPGGRNVISGNTNYGIEIDNSSSNRVLGNYIGTDAAGESAIGNGPCALFIQMGAKYNKIGDGTDDGRNIMSGNAVYGMVIGGAGTSSNEVAGNYIGVNQAGTRAVPNGYGGTQLFRSGIMISTGAQFSSIEGNIISGNNGSGICILGQWNYGAISKNKISHNKIGTGADGSVSIPNTEYGILGYSYSNPGHIIQNTIGPSNIIANNGNTGISLESIYVTSETITQNSIYNNYGSGIRLVNHANSDIPDPVVSTAELSGTTLTVSGTSQANAVVEIFKASGNQGETYLITTSDASGNWKWSGTVGGFSAGSGVCVTQTKNGNTSQFSATREVTIAVIPQHGVVTNCLDDIDTPGSLRYVLAHAGSGDTIRFFISSVPDSTGPGSPGIVTNEAAGKKWYRIIVNSPLPAIDVAGIQILGSTQTWEANNTGPSVEVRANGGFDIFKCKSGYVTIEGLTINRIGADDLGAGISLESGADNTHIYGCYIGTTATGEAAAPNRSYYGIVISGAKFCRIGGTEPAQRNVISGNRTGVDLATQADSNEVVGNYIGTDKDGLSSIQNTYGVFLYYAKYNRIGNGAESGRNVISGNKTVGGIYMTSAGTEQNKIIGNYIGVDRNGASSIANGSGIYLRNSAHDNMIGDGMSGGLNVISGNTEGVRIEDPGTDRNVVAGNYIGTNADGTASIPNDYGIYLNSGAKNNNIGNETASVRNIISGNDLANIYMIGPGTDGNELWNNYIGPANGALSVLSGSRGIVIHNGVNSTTIEGNDISNNTAAGILIQADTGATGAISDNNIRHNTIQNNASYGIRAVNSAYSDRRILRNMIGPSNIISGNITAGISLEGPYVTSETITQNFIYNNTGIGISLVNHSNSDVPVPVVVTAELSGTILTVAGTSQANANVEVFKASGNQGEKCLATTSDATGNWKWIGPASDVVAGSFVTATQTDTVGNTSQFSATREVTILASYRPDAMVGVNSDGTGYRSINVYEDTPATQVLSRDVSTKQTAEAYFKLYNAGNVPDSFIVTGDASSGDFTVKYYDARIGGGDITGPVTSGTVMSFSAGTSREIRAEVSYSGTVQATKEVTLTAGSTNDASKKDAVKAVITFTPYNYQPDGMVGTYSNGSDYLTEGIFEDTPTAQVQSLSVPKKEKAVFYYKLKNAGTIPGFSRVSAEAGGGLFTVSYYNAKTGGTDITGALTGGGSLYPGQSTVGAYVEFRAEITYSGTGIATKEISITAVSSVDSGKKDIVKARATFLPSSGVSAYDMTYTPKAISGEAFGAAITAKKADGSVQTSIVEDVALSVDSGTVTPGAISASSFSSGAWAANMTIYKMGNRTLTVSDGFSSGSLVVPVYNAFRIFSGTELGIPGLTVTLPAGTTTSEADAAVTAVEVTGLPGSPPPGYDVAGKLIDIRPSGAVFLVPLTLTMPLTVKPRDPRVYYWDGSKWSADGISVVSYASDSITFTTTHFSVFAPMVSLAANLIRFGPNPYNPNSGTAGVIWYWLDKDANTSVYVIDVAGRLVWKQDFFAGMSGAKAGANSVPFDGKNQSGDILGDGIYLYKIIQGGKSIGGGKIAIVK